MDPIILKKLRKEANMTQADLAKILSIQKSTYAQYEQGVHQPKPDIEMMIARHFHVSLDYLNGGSQYEKIERLMNKDYVSNVKGYTLMDEIWNLSQAHREALYLCLQGFAALERHEAQDK